jgi:hypothetical protein
MGEGHDTKPALGRKHHDNKPSHEELATPDVQTAKTGVAAGSHRDHQDHRDSIDFSELDEAYDNLATAENVILNKRAIGIREVHGNLNEADAPSITDEILKTLAVTGLGFASGYITAKIANSAVSSEMYAALNNAIQTALDDGLKDAALKIAGKIAEGTGSSKATFFAGQEEGIESLRKSTLEAVAAEKRKAKQKVNATAPADRELQRTEQQASVNTLRYVTDQNADRGRNIQYQASLANWMSAMAQSKLGVAGGTNLRKDLDRSPKDHYSKTGVNGVIYVAFGMHPARRPFFVDGKRSTIKVAGITEAARDRIKDTPIKDLGMPVIASGFIYDGALDALSISLIDDNEIAFGKNEAGNVWTYGHDDARDGLKKAAQTKSETEAARIILDEDIGSATLKYATIG